MDQNNNMDYMPPQQPKSGSSIWKTLFFLLLGIVIGIGVMFAYQKHEDKKKPEVPEIKEIEKNEEIEEKEEVEKTTPVDEKVPEKSTQPAATTYKKATYTREQICGKKESCEKTFTYGGKSYKLVIKSSEDYPNMDELYTTTINGKVINFGMVDYLDKVYFTDNGLIALAMSNYQYGEGNVLAFFDTNLKMIKSYSSIKPVEYNGGYSGKFFECEVFGEEDDDQLLKTFEFSFTKNNVFTQKKVSEKKQFCTAQN